MPTLPRGPAPHIFLPMDVAAATREGFDLVVNGDPVALPGPTTVTGLLNRLGLDPRKVAVERNEAIVPRSTYDTVALTPGDGIEIVHFIGGG